MEQAPVRTTLLQTQFTASGPNRIWNGKNVILLSTSLPYIRRVHQRQEGAQGCQELPVGRLHPITNQVKTQFVRLNRRAIATQGCNIFLGILFPGIFCYDEDELEMCGAIPPTTPASWDESIPHKGRLAGSCVCPLSSQLYDTVYI